MTGLPLTPDPHARACRLHRAIADDPARLGICDVGALGRFDGCEACADWWRTHSPLPLPPPVPRAEP